MSRRYSPTPEQLARSQVRRAELCALSRQIRQAQEAGVAPFADLPTINDGLQLIYASRTGQKDWATLLGWRERGFAIEKGSSGFAIWGRPRGSAAAQAPADRNAPAPAAEVAVAEEDGTKFFPVGYLFHAGQVRDAQGNRPPSFVAAPSLDAIPADAGDEDGEGLDHVAA